jgi:hypothetical protein
LTGGRRFRGPPINAKDRQRSTATWKMRRYPGSWQASARRSQYWRERRKTNRHRVLPILLTAFHRYRPASGESFCTYRRDLIASAFTRIPSSRLPERTSKRPCAHSVTIATVGPLPIPLGDRPPCHGGEPPGDRPPAASPPSRSNPPAARQSCPGEWTPAASFLEMCRQSTGSRRQHKPRCGS